MGVLTTAIVATATIVGAASAVKTATGIAADVNEVLGSLTGRTLDRPGVEKMVDRVIKRIDDLHSTNKHIETAVQQVLQRLDGLNDKSDRIEELMKRSVDLLDDLRAAVNEGVGTLKFISAILVKEYGMPERAAEIERRILQLVPPKRVG